MTEQQRPSLSTAYDHACTVVVRARTNADEQPVAPTYFASVDSWPVAEGGEATPAVVEVEAFPAVPVFVARYAPGTVVRFCSLPIGADGNGCVWVALVVHGTQHVFVPVEAEVAAALDELAALRTKHG